MSEHRLLRLLPNSSEGGLELPVDTGLELTLDKGLELELSPETGRELPEDRDLSGWQLSSCEAVSLAILVQVTFVMVDVDAEVDKEASLAPLLFSSTLSAESNL